MAQLRPILPLPLPTDVVAAVPPTAAPEIIWVSPDQLRVNDAYQRSLSERSVTLIHKIVATFDWRNLKPPVVTAGEDEGTYEVIDGQHTAIAAATHGGIQQLPVLLIDAGVVSDRAKSFLSHNRDRVAMSATQLFYAAVAAGDEDALTVKQVCERAGARILRLPPSNGRFVPGDTMAVSVIKALVGRRGAMKARIAIEACVKGRAAPVSSDLIKAAEEVLFGQDYAGNIDPEDLSTTILRVDALAPKVAELALAKSLPKWRALVIALYQNTKKKRRA